MFAYLRALVKQIVIIHYALAELDHLPLDIGHHHLHLRQATSFLITAYLIDSCLLLKLITQVVLKINCEVFGCFNFYLHGLYLVILEVVIGFKFPFLPRLRFLGRILIGRPFCKLHYFII